MVDGTFATNHPRRNSAGMSLLELTVVIVVLVALISIMMLSASAWKTGADRAKCILNLSRVQKAARSYQNMNQVAVGSPFEPSLLLGASGFLEVLPDCPSGDAQYKFATEFPPSGVMFVTCSISLHKPPSTNDW